MSRLLKLFLAQIFALADSTVFAGGCGSTVSAGFGGSMVFSSCGGLTVLMGWGSTVLTICSRFAGFLFENCCSVGVPSWVTGCSLSDYQNILPPINPK